MSSFNIIFTTSKPEKKLRLKLETDGCCPKISDNELRELNLLYESLLPENKIQKILDVFTDDYDLENIMDIYPDDYEYEQIFSPIIGGFSLEYVINPSIADNRMELNRNELGDDVLNRILSFQQGQGKSGYLKLVAEHRNSRNLILSILNMQNDNLIANELANKIKDFSEKGNFIKMRYIDFSGDQLFIKLEWENS